MLHQLLRVPMSLTCTVTFPPREIIHPELHQQCLVQPATVDLMAFILWFLQFFKCIYYHLAWSLSQGCCGYPLIQRNWIWLHPEVDAAPSMPETHGHSHTK